MVRQRIRLHFSKSGNLCFIGHRDLLRTMERLFRRAQLPLAMSEGFHPKQRVSYVSALSLGYSSEDEIMEIILTEERDPSNLLDCLNKVSVQGLVFHSATILSASDKKSQAASFCYEMNVPSHYRVQTLENMERFLQSSTVLTTKSNGKTVDARQPVRVMRLDIQNRLQLEIAAQTGPEAGVREILNCLELGNELFRSIFPVRKKTCLL
ncbi:MAG: TIGR03936 family radical SAM-associated protein [Planctomycetia bacterium]|nr:TIGR03936 family radical SAM-associated protein [Planctomycetia bacterium]